MMQSFYVRTAALALSVISILILRANLMMTEYLVCWFSVLFNFLFLFEFSLLACSGRSPSAALFSKVHSGVIPIIVFTGALNVLAAMVFFVWALLTAMKTHAANDFIITAIQGVYIMALGVALGINNRYYHEIPGERLHNLLLIGGITYTVSVFMAARLLQGSIIMPWQVLASAMGNIVLAVLAMVVTNPSGPQGD
jgi:hypothetical protein